MPAGRRSILLAAAVAACSLVALVQAAEDGEYAGAGEQFEPDAASQGGQGLVIELDRGTGGEPGAEGAAGSADMQPRELADSDVEMIIGGEGKDGIAKRGRLKKED